MNHFPHHDHSANNRRSKGKSNRYTKSDTVLPLRNILFSHPLIRHPPTKDNAVDYPHNQPGHGKPSFHRRAVSCAKPRKPPHDRKWHQTEKGAHAEDDLSGVYWAICVSERLSI